MLKVNRLSESTAQKPHFGSKINFRENGILKLRALEHASAVVSWGGYT